MPSVKVAPEPWLKPLPTISSENTPFWDGLKAHKFVIPKCNDCGSYNWLPSPACRDCLSENLTWTEVSGRATVWTFTVVHRGPGAFGLEVPYVMAFGQLEEQPRKNNVLANLYGIDPSEVKIGMPIEIGYVDIPSEGTTMYEWVPRA